MLKTKFEMHTLENFLATALLVAVLNATLIVLQR